MRPRQNKDDDEKLAKLSSTLRAMVKSIKQPEIVIAGYPQAESRKEPIVEDVSEGMAIDVPATDVEKSSPVMKLLKRR